LRDLGLVVVLLERCTRIAIALPGIRRKTTPTRLLRRMSVTASAPHVKALAMAFNVGDLREL
jgi:hypothetical protein